MARQGKTQSWLAQELSVTEAYLSRRMRGAVSITFDEVDAIADVLGCDPVAFVVPTSRPIKVAS